SAGLHLLPAKTRSRLPLVNHHRVRASAEVIACAKPLSWPVSRALSSAAAFWPVPPCWNTSRHSSTWNSRLRQWLSATANRVVNDDAGLCQLTDNVLLV